MADHLLPSRFEVKERVELYLHVSCIRLWHVQSNFNFTLLDFPTKVLCIIALSWRAVGRSGLSFRFKHAKYKMESKDYEAYSHVICFFLFVRFLSYSTLCIRLHSSLRVRDILYYAVRFMAVKSLV